VALTWLLPTRTRLIGVIGQAFALLAVLAWGLASAVRAPEDAAKQTA
jgi:hypothetical protein